MFCRTSPWKKRDALSAVRTPDETVWSLRASDIYQGGENEPLQADGDVPGSHQVTGQPAPKKLPSGSCAQRLRSSQKSKFTHDSAFPAIKSYTFDKNEHRDIRLAAQELGQTANDYLLEKLFLTLKEWNRQHRRLPWPQSLGVMLPMDLREQETRFPAANILTYSFIRRRGRNLHNRELLVKSLREEIFALKRNRHQTRFMNMVMAGQYYPQILRRILLRERCLATATLSNTGDPTKQFYAQLPREKGVIRCGNLMLEEISGVPPLRPKTHATLSIFTYRRKLKICVRCDPHYFSLDDTQQFLDSYVNFIREHAKG